MGFGTVLAASALKRGCEGLEYMEKDVNDVNDVKCRT